MINKPGAKFCGSCGNKFEGAGAPPPARPVYTPGAQTPARSPQPSARPSYIPPGRMQPPMPVQRPAYSPPAQVQSMPVQRALYAPPSPVQPMPVQRPTYTPPAQVTQDVFAIEPAEDEEAFALDRSPIEDEEVFQADLSSESDEEDFSLDSQGVMRTSSGVVYSGSSGDFIDRMFQADSTIMDMFIMKEILSPPRAMQKRKRRL